MAAVPSTDVAEDGAGLHDQETLVGVHALSSEPSRPLQAEGRSIEQEALPSTDSWEVEKAESSRLENDRLLPDAARSSDGASCSDRISVWGRLVIAGNQLHTCVWNSGIVSIGVASTIMSINALMIKIVLVRISVLELVVARSAFCWLLSVTIMRLHGSPSLYGRRENFIALLVRGVTGACAMTAYYYALEVMSLGDAITLFFFNPAMTTLLAWVLLGEAMGWASMVGFAASLVGVVCVARPPFMFGEPEPWTRAHITGVVMAIAAAFMSACAFVSIRFMSKSESALSIALWFHTVSVLMALVLLGFGVGGAAVMPGPLDATIMIFVGASSFLGQLLLGRGYQLEVASKVAAVNYIQVLLAHFFGITFLGDRMSALGILGALLIALGVVMANASKTPSKEPLLPTKSAFVLPLSEVEELHIPYRQNGYEPASTAEDDHGGGSPGGKPVADGPRIAADAPSNAG